MRVLILVVLSVFTGSAIGCNAPPPAAAPARTTHTLTIRVTEDGFQPSELKLKKGEPTTLAITRATENTCITAIDIPDEGVKELELPLNKAVTVTLTPKKVGVEKFHCSAMGMGDGRLVIGD